MEKQEYIYILHLIDRLQDDNAWTDADNTIVEKHFSALQRREAEGDLILAGRTIGEDTTSFGIVIFKAGSAEEAEVIMQSDPAVKEGIMTAELFPYRVALLSEKNWR